MKYNTFDYFRDNYEWLDKFLNLLSVAMKKLLHLSKKVVDSEIDAYIFRFLENLPYFFIIIFLGFFLVLGLIRVSEKENGLKVYNITTSSMQPVIMPGSLVFSYPDKRYTEGDIINYKEKNNRTDTYTGRVLTHRIINIREEDGFYKYTAKGDNNNLPDPREITTSDISGQVFLIIPFLGYVDYLVRTLPGFLVFIGVPAYILVKEAKHYLRQNN